MSSPIGEDTPTAEEGLKFVTFFLRAYEEEFGEPPSVNNELFSAIVLNEAVDDVNLVFEMVDEKIIIKAVRHEDE